MRTSLEEKIERWEEFAQDAGYSAGRLAKLLGVSGRHLRRLFLKTFSRSPGAMLEEKQMRDAQAALDTRHRIKDIASELHYKHSGSFSHWFKAREKMTPSEFARRDP